MSDGAKLLLVEQIVPTGNDYHSSKFDDLNMLVFYRGHERTAEEFRILLAMAGFTLSRILPTSFQWSVVEAVPT
jgi:O-methyltransferase domain